MMRGDDEWRQVDFESWLIMMANDIEESQPKVIKWVIASNFVRLKEIDISKW